MNKSTITREQVVALIAEHSYDSALVDALEHLLAAIDSEPVAEITEDLGRLFVKIHYPTTLRAGDKLYLHAQTATAGEPVLWAWQHLDMWHVTSHHGRARDLGLSGFKVIPLYRHAQPAPVAQEEMTPEQAYEIGDYHGDPVDVFARGANWMRQHIIDSTLAASPQSPGSEPATVPGKWIPVSERMPLTPSADCEYSDIEVNVFDGERVFTAHYATGSQPQPWGYWVDTYAKITHWQPLPAAPQEVKP